MRNAAEDPAGAPTATRRWTRVLGWILVIASVPVWIAVFFVPTLPVAAPQKVGVATALAVVGEVFFWAGGAILGASVLARFRRRKDRTAEGYSVAPELDHGAP